MISQPFPLQDLRGARPAAGQTPTEIDVGFDDLIDIINPLQHVPIVGSVYRAISNDDLSPLARIAGGTLFGGVAGFLGALASGLYEAIAGEGLEETVVSLFTPSAPSNIAPGAQAYLTQQNLSSDEIERRALGALPRVSIVL
jgi:hypothetical protein